MLFRSNQVKLTPCVLAAIISVLCVANAKAVPITYTEFATVSGTLNGVSFPSGEVLTLTGTGDTTNVVNVISNVFVNIVTTASFTLSVSVGGVGSGTFTDTISVFVSQSNSAGFNDQDVISIILETLSNTAFASYALSTSIGPITGTSGINSGASFPTTAGALVLTSSAGNATWASTVPLPTALPLFATGLGALGLLGWRRKRKAAA
jgi:hypothetical protein